MAARALSRWIPACACAALCAVVTLTLALSTTFPLPTGLLPHTVRAIDQPAKPSLLPRSSSNLLYWTPHKTGSTSLRKWMYKATRLLKLPIFSYNFYYPLSNITQFRDRAPFLADSCTMLGGHIRILPIDQRLHEGTLGAIITTTRDPVDTLISKYFHRTAHNLIREVGKLALENSTESRLWFYHWNDYDPCEQLRYYDGMDGCVAASVPQRVQRIAERIDCVIDTDDPTDDIEALCAVMHMEECPEFPFFNAGGHSYYWDVRQVDHLMRQLDRVVHVTIMLRDALMQRRCRFLKDGTLTTPGLEPPRWPRPGCDQPPQGRIEGSGSTAGALQRRDSTHVLDM